MSLRNHARAQILSNSPCQLFSKFTQLMFLDLKIRKAMNIIEFITHFLNEKSCEIYLKAYRENTGIYCKTFAGFSKQYWFSGSKFFECSKCRSRTSLKAGTVMESSNLSFHTWLLRFY